MAGPLTPEELDAELKRLGVTPTGGGQPAASPSTQPPAGFTVPVPGSGGTSFYNPDSRYVWSAPQGTNGTPFITRASNAEVERITGSAPATAGPTQTLPPPLPGFNYIPNTDRTYAPPAPGSRTGALGQTAYYNTSTGKWSVSNATASDVALARGSVAQGGNTGTQPAAAGTPVPTNQPISSAPVTPPPGVLASPYAQTQGATKSLVTPQSTGLPQQSVQVPFTYQGGPSGLQSVSTPQGQQNIAVPHEFSFGPANFNPAIPAAAPATTPRPQDPLAVGTSAGLTSTGMAPPPPTPQGLFRPPNVGDAGLVSQQLGATGPINSTLSSERQAFVNQMYPTALAWSQQTGIPPEVYLAINGSESNFGRAGSLFGVMGQGDAGSKAYDTHEVVNGQNVPTNSNFANYTSPNAAYQGFQSFLQDNPRYAPALAQFAQDHDSGALLQNINRAGYATDPNWATMIQSMANDIRPNLPNAVTGAVGQGFSPIPVAPAPGAPPTIPIQPIPGGGGGGGSYPPNTPPPLHWDGALKMVVPPMTPEEEYKYGGASPAHPYPSTMTGNYGPIPQVQTLPGYVAPPGTSVPSSPIAPGVPWYQSLLNNTNAMAPQPAAPVAGRPQLGAPDMWKDMVGGATNALNTYAPPRPAPDMWGRMINGANNIASMASGAGAPTGPAIPPAPPQTNLFYSGPQTFAMSNNGLADRIGGLNGATGYNPQVILAGNGIKSTGDADLDATIAAQLIQKQNAAGAAAGFGDPLASKGVGASGVFQSPLSGQLENEQRTDHGYAFSPGNVNATESLRSPMNSGMYTPIMTPQGVVLQGANNAGSPAAQAVGYQQAGYGVRPGGAIPDATQAPYLMAPTSNVGAVIQAAQAGPQQYASAANLPSQQALDTLAQANKDPLAGNTDFQNAGGGMMGDNGGTRFFASGGNFDEPAGGIENRLGGVEGGYGHGTPARINFGGNQNGPVDPVALEKALQSISASAHTGYIPQNGGQPNVAHPMMLANGGSFITTQPTVFPMANGGRAVTSEYGQPELINEQGSRVNVVPLHGYAQGGSFNANTQGANTTVLDGGGFTPEGNPIPTDAPSPAAPPPVAPSPNDPFTQQGNPTAAPYIPPITPADAAPTNNNQFTPQGGLNPNYVTPATPPAPTQNLNFNTPSSTAGDLSIAPLTPGPAAQATPNFLDTNPELDTQTALANQQNARNNRAYLYSAAGVGAPIGISSQTQPTNLGPNQFWQPIDYTGQIQNRQTQLAALGPNILGADGQPLDPNSLLSRQNVLRDMLGRVWGGNQPVVSGGNQPAPQGGITDIDPGVNDPTTGQWMTQSQIQAEMAANSLKTQQIQQANQLESEITNLRSNQPSVTASTPQQQQLQPVQQLAQQAATPGAWTPASSDSLVLLAQQATTNPELQAQLLGLTNTLKASRAVPPGLAPAAYSNPVAMAAAAKFA